MSGHTIGLDTLKAHDADLLLIPDVATGGVFDVQISGGHISIETTGTETRKLPDPSNMGLGTELTLFMDADGGNCTVTVDSTAAAEVNAADDTDIVFADVGDVVLLKVISRSGSRYWHVVAIQGASTA